VKPVDGIKGVDSTKLVSIAECHASLKQPLIKILSTCAIFRTVLFHSKITDEFSNQLLSLLIAELARFSL